MTATHFVAIAPNAFLGFISLIALLLFVCFTVRLLQPRSRVDSLLIGFLLLCTAIVLLGYLASHLNLLSSPGWWAFGGIVLLAGSLAPAMVNPRWRAICLRPPGGVGDLRQLAGKARLHPYEKFLLVAMGAALLTVMLVSLIVIFALKPATPDVLEYHLARVAYYLQHGNLRYFDAGYWAQVIHPKVAAVLMAYLMLVSGLRDNVTQLVQFAAYLVSILAVYGIARHLGAKRRGSLFAAFGFGLLTINIVEATTAQNDLVMTAFIAVTLYLLLAYRSAHQVKYLVLAAVAIAMAAGVKATVAGALPSLLVVALGLLLPRRGGRPVLSPAHAGWGAAALAVSLLAITASSGYLEIHRQFGSPFGPAAVRSMHSFAGAGPGEVVRQGSKNLLRYGIEFISLEGFGPFRTPEQVQRGLRALPEAVVRGLGIDIETPDQMRLAFSYDKSPAATENTSYWGILGFTLVWPVVLLALFGVLVRTREARILALAAVVFFVVQAYMSPYDAWRGRYFIAGALFALPPLAFLALPPRRVLGQVYVAAVVALGCLSAVIASGLRNGTYLVTVRATQQADGPPPISSFTPIDQLIPPSLYTVPPPFTEREFKRLLTESTQYTRVLPVMAQGKIMYEVNVPPDAVVALDTQQRMPTYLLFGPRLTRNVVPIRAFSGERGPIPANATCLVYDLESPYARPGDLPLYVEHPYYGTVFFRPLP